MDLEEGEEGELSAVQPLHNAATAARPGQDGSAPDLQPSNRRYGTSHRTQQSMLQSGMMGSNVPVAGSVPSSSRFDKRSADRPPEFQQQTTQSFSDRRMAPARQAGSVHSFVDVRDVNRRSLEGSVVTSSARPSGLLGAGPMDDRRAPSHQASILGPAAAKVATPPPGPLLPAQSGFVRHDSERRSRFEERPGPRPLLPHTPSIPPASAVSTPQVQGTGHSVARTSSASHTDMGRGAVTPVLQPAPKGLLPAPTPAGATPVVQPPPRPPQAASTEGRIFLSSHAVGVAGAQLETALEVMELKSRSLARLQLLFPS